jgi:hypothetical protein
MLAVMCACRCCNWRSGCGRVEGRCAETWMKTCEVWGSCGRGCRRAVNGERIKFAATTMKEVAPQCGLARSGGGAGPVALLPHAAPFETQTEPLERVLSHLSAVLSRTFYVPGCNRVKCLCC